MAKREKSSYLIKSVVNALDLLEEFSGDVRELGVTELSKRLRLHKNNVFRLLATLEHKGYIEQNKETENYHLGLKSLELGQTYLRQIGLIRQTRSILEELVRSVEENAGLAVIRENSVVYLDVVEADRTVRVASRIGWRLPVYVAAVGRAQLAFKSETEMERLINWDDMKKFTEGTIPDKETFMQQMRQVKEQGWALDDESYETGVRCVAVPIFDYSRNVVAGISIAGPSFRLSDKVLHERVVPELTRAGNEMSKRLGYGT